MKDRSKSLTALDHLVLVFFTWLGVCSLPAHAYLDPGTGSFIIQVLIAGFLGGVATIKLWWHKFIGLFSGKKTPAITDSDSKPEKSDTSDAAKSTDADSADKE